MRTTALVIETDPPIGGLGRWGDAAKGTVTILVADGPDGPIFVARELRLNEDRWLVRGMQIPVSLDPGRPERFEVEWDAIPSIEERVAANDPALADPAGTRRRVAAALEAAGISVPAAGMAHRGMTGGVGLEPRGESSNRLAEAIEKAAHSPAPPGKQRAVVVIASLTSSADRGGGEGFDASVNGPP